MSIVHSIDIDASEAEVFKVYADVASWPAWDSETEHVHLPHGLRAGATGWLKPKAGPKTNIGVRDIADGESFTIEARLPLCRMQFGHELQAREGGTTATHWVRFTGPLAFLFRRVIGAGTDATLPGTLAGLKRICEVGRPVS